MTSCNSMTKSSLSSSTCFSFIPFPAFLLPSTDLPASVITPLPTISPYGLGKLQVLVRSTSSIQLIFVNCDAVLNILIDLDTSFSRSTSSFCTLLEPRFLSLPLSLSIFATSSRQYFSTTSFDAVFIVVFVFPLPS
ncbi:hypothetical protein Droror1_Dr00008709 [Drosera rotundifolia]